MNGTAIVTDSTGDLSPDTALQQGITVVPLHVLHGDKAYRDGVDITPEEFYPLLESGGDLPKTSQPTPDQFKKVYSDFLQQGKDIISFHISKGLSSTVDAARTAAESLSAGGRIHVVDSRYLSYGLGFQVLEASRLASEGRPAAAIVEQVARLREKMEMLFSLRTMHYLYKGGRIGKVSSIMGSVLDIKPVIRVEDGIYVPVGKVRGMKQALESIVDYLRNVFGRQKVIAAVGHGQGAEYAAELRSLVESRLNLQEKPIAFKVGPVIGVHTGPGTVGLAVRPADYSR